MPNPRKLDLAGLRFGRLLVIRMDHINKHQQSMWLCRCDCGNKIVTSGSTLKGGRSKSCGCWKADVAREQETSHGLSRSPEYRTYYYMKQRCYNPKNTHYHLYGGRGIKICQRWLRSFERFYADMGPRPSPKHSIDRINYDGDYAPDNCRWATIEEQYANRRPRRIYETSEENRRRQSALAKRQNRSRSRDHHGRFTS